MDSASNPGSIIPLKVKVYGDVEFLVKKADEKPTTYNTQVGKTTFNGVMQMSDGNIVDFASQPESCTNETVSATKGDVLLDVNDGPNINIYTGPITMLSDKHGVPAHNPLDKNCTCPRCLHQASIFLQQRNPRQG
jgi:hypothetical protein